MKRIQCIFLVFSLLFAGISAKNEPQTDKIAVQPLSAACQARQTNTGQDTMCYSWNGTPLNGPSPYPCACLDNDKDGGCFPGTGQTEQPNSFSLGFTDYTIGKNPTDEFSSLTAMAFTDNTNEIYVLAKAGIVFRVDTNTEQISKFHDFSDQVHNLGDFGGLSIEVHTDFKNNPYVYVSYVNGSLVGGLNFNTVSFVRVLRLTSNNGVLSDQKFILGTNYLDSNPLCSSSHAGGALAMGHDGSLFITLGEGSHFDTDVMDFGQAQDRYPVSNRCGEFFPGQNMGAMKAQSLDTLGGKLIRVDPETGNGICAGNTKFSVYNPYCTGDIDLRSPRARIWALGFRNPFSMNVRPKQDGETGPGVPYVGDVGLGSFEEVNAVTAPRQNFGWPCWEGPMPMGGYRDSPLNDLALEGIVRPKDDNGNPINCPYVYENVETEHPIYYWSRYTHSMGGLYGEQYVLGAGFTGNCVSGVTFYTGDKYPPSFKNQVFFADYGTQWIKSFSTDGPDTFKAQYHFRDLNVPVVQLEINPKNGDVCYLELLGGVIHCLSYTDEIQPPEVTASCNVTGGEAPLAVGFNIDGTYDPRGNSVSFVAWTFGDDTPYVVDPNPTHVYTKAGTYTATVHVNNGKYTTSKTVTVKVGDPVPTAIMTAPAAGTIDSFSFFSYNTEDLTFTGSAAGGTAPYTYFWDVYMVHTNHYHPQSSTNTLPSFTATLDDLGAASHLGERINFLVILKVTDAKGYTSQTYSRLNVDGWYSNPPIPSFSFAPATQITTGQPIRFDASKTVDNDLDTITYVWNFGDGNVIQFSPEQNNRFITHSYSKPGTYTVVLKAVDNWGVSAETTQTITVSEGFVQNPPDLKQFFENLPTITQTTGQTGSNPIDVQSNTGVIGVSTTATSGASSIFTLASLIVAFLMAVL